MALAILFVVVIVLLGVGGVLVTHEGKRLILWVLSIPFIFIGVFALNQGGITEHFSSGMMFVFCSIMFWPAIGCAIGEIRKAWSEPKIPDKSKED